jgi:hypothetical protein
LCVNVNDAIVEQKIMMIEIHVAEAEISSSKEK